MGKDLRDKRSLKARSNKKAFPSTSTCVCPRCAENECVTSLHIHNSASWSGASPHLNHPDADSNSTRIRYDATSSSPHSGRSNPANHHMHQAGRPLNFPGIRPSFDQSSFVHFSFQFSPNNNFLPIGNLRRCSEGGEAKARLHFCLLIVQVLETSGTATTTAGGRKLPEHVCVVLRLLYVGISTASTGPWRILHMRRLK